MNHVFLESDPLEEELFMLFFRGKRNGWSEKGSKGERKGRIFTFLKVNRIKAIFEFSKAFALQWNLAKMNCTFYMDNCCLCFKYAAN